MQVLLIDPTSLKQLVPWQSLTRPPMNHILLLSNAYFAKQLIKVWKNILMLIEPRIQKINDLRLASYL